MNRVLLAAELVAAVGCARATLRLWDGLWWGPVLFVAAWFAAGAMMRLRNLLRGER